MDDALRVKLDGRRRDRLRVEGKFENIIRLDQSWRAGAREEIAARIGRVAQAYMPERIEHAFVGQYTIGQGDFRTGGGQAVGHGFSALEQKRSMGRSKAEMAALAKPRAQISPRCTADAWTQGEGKTACQGGPISADWALLRG